MKRINKKRIVAMLLSCLILISCSINVFAAPFSSYRLNGGVGQYGNFRRYWWVDSSASQFTGTISAAMDSWIYTTNRLGITTSISWRQTSTKKDGTLELYYGNYYSSDTLAATEFWLYQNQVSPTTSNWGWGKIRLNGTSYNNLSSSGKQATMAHEIGHIFGLAHTNNNPNTIMCQTWNRNPSVIAVTYGECQIINQMYG